MRALGYAEIAIVVEDVERSVRFYVDVVGYEVADVDVGEGGRIMKVGPDHFLGLWEPNVWGKDGLPFDETYGAEFRKQVRQAHLVFAVYEDEIEPLKERLIAADVPVHGPETHGDGSLHLYASDPDGHPMEWWGKTPS